MVNYSYSDYFYKNKKKDILVVDVGATVTAVSGEAPTVSGATVEIHTEDLQIETFELEENLCSEDNLKFGLCEAARMSFTIENKATIPGLATNDFDQMLNVYIYFDGDSDTLFQVGQYVCKSDEYSADRQLRNIELYDMLYYLYDLDITAWYNKAYSDNGGLPITVYNLRNSLFTWLVNEADYPIAQETTTLVNDGMSVAKTIDSDYISFGDFMQGLLEANGVFGHIGRTGLFEYKGLVWYDQPSVATITDDFRKPPTQYKDYTTWGVGFVQVYQDDELVMSVGSTNRRHPSNYSIVDNFVFKDIKKQNQGGAILNLALTNLREKITHLRYKPCEVECAGNLCLEVGDKIDVTYDKDGDGVTDTFYTFILERRLKGLNMMLDTYSARGNKKQPKPDIRTNYGGSNTTESEGTATSGEGTSGVTLYDSENDRLLMEKMRNAGFRFLDEPVTNVVYDRANNEVEITWSDPSDISTQQPHECEWAGTCVIRKENSAPLNRWDGTLIVKSTTRDQYSENAYIDNTIEPNKRYYYAIMPYYIALDDSSNSIAHYTWTKVFSVNTANFIYAPMITGLQVYDVNVIATFEIPTLESGSYSYIKIVAKKGSIPTSKTDGRIKDVTASDTGVQFTGLDPESRYYFVIFASDGVTEVASDPDDCLTGLASYAFFEKLYTLAPIVLYDHGVYHEEYFNPSSLVITKSWVSGSEKAPTVTFGNSDISIYNDSVSGTTREYKVAIGSFPSGYRRLYFEYEYSAKTTAGYSASGVSVNQNAEIQYYFKGGIYNKKPRTLSQWNYGMIGDSSGGTNYNINDSETSSRTIVMNSPTNKLELYVVTAGATQETFKIKKLVLMP